uniref:PRC2B n=1 Tax=Poeciliopsis prolifica TaxID=188132 RepID=A0A0S7EV38_9TELE
MKTGSIAQKKEASVCQSTPLAIAIVKSTILAVMMMARNFLPLQMTTVDAKRPNQFHPAFKSSNSTTSSRNKPPKCSIGSSPVIPQAQVIASGAIIPNMCLGLIPAG